MVKKSALASALLAATLTASALAQPPKPGDNISFVSCPIMQDTNTVPCWVTEYAGEKYFLGIQTDASGWSAPYLKHRILVEGRVADVPRVCGGIVLESSGTPFERGPSGSVAGIALPNPPVTSNLRELDLSCNSILPANERYNNLEPRRGPGPNVRREPQTPEQIAAARARAEEARQARIPVPPYQNRSFQLHYEFDSELAVLNIGNANEALQYARAVNAKHIKITSYRASSLLSDGTRLVEVEFIARKRAEELAAVMQQLGIPEGIELEVTWSNEINEGDGISDWEGRVTEIEVFPG
jgi:hypothetical protein